MRRLTFAHALALAVALVASAADADETFVAHPTTTVLGPAPTPDPAPAAAAVIVPDPAAAPAPDAAPAEASADPALASTGARPASAAPALTDPAAAATTAAPPPPAPASAEAQAEPDAAPRLPRLGVGLGAGVPEFAALTVLYRPLRFLRLGAGPTWNYYGWGGHVGLSVVPGNWWITPVLAFEAGHYLRTSYSGAVRGSSQTADDLRQLLARTDYSYTAVDLGLELGSPRGFSVSLRTGLAFVWVDARGTSTRRSDNGSVVSITNPAIRATLPSTKLAFQYWF
jgi:hypothetical protein